MRLLVDARYVRPVHDGISRYTASLLHALKVLVESGEHPDLQVAMVVSDPRQLPQLPELPWVRGVSPTGPLEPLASWFLRRHRPDVLFSPMQTIGSLGRNFALVLTLHDLIYYDHPTPPGFLPAPVRLGWRLFHTTYLPQRLLLDRADAVVTVSETTRRLMAAHRLTRRPVAVVPNAAPQAPVSAEVAVARIPGRGKSLLCMGSAMPYKRIETLVQAAGLLPDYTLHLLSKYPPARKRELQALVPEGARVLFHDGVSDPEYRQLLERCTALVTASAAEGYGLPVAEALAAGTPVVLSDIPIFREIAPSQLHVDGRDPEAFAAAVRTLEDPETCRERVLAGLQDVARYSWEDSARRLLEVAASVRRRSAGPGDQGGQEAGAVRS